MKKMSMRNFIIISVMLHIVAIICTLILSNTERNVGAKFIMFGAHSASQPHMLWKMNQKRQVTSSTPSGKNAKINSSKKNVKPIQKKQQQKKQKNKKNAKKVATIPELSTKQKQKKKKQKKGRKPQEDPPVVKEREKKELRQKSMIPVDQDAQNNPLKEQSKKEDEVVQLSEEPVEQPRLEEQEVAEITTPDEITALGDPDAVDVDMSVDYVQAEGFEYNAAIKDVIMRSWRPPGGVTQGVSAVVLFEVDEQGNIAHFEFLKKSNVVIFDASIKLCAKKHLFPQVVWGKKIMIKFQQ